MATTIAELMSLGELPSTPFLVENLARKSWDLLTGKTLRNLCRDHARTWIHVDSIGGSDSNSGLSEAFPKRTLTSASASLGSSIGLKLKRGSVFKNESISLGHFGSGAIAYGEGPNPLLWRSDLVVGTWTNPAGNRWAITVPNFDTALVMVGDPDDPDDVVDILNKPYQRVQSEAACESTPGTYHQTGQTLSIHTYGSLNPNTLEVHRVHRTLTTPNASGIRMQNFDLLYVADIDVIGYGDVSGQTWLLRSEVGGTNLHAVERCGLHFASGHHCCGRYSNSGGTFVFLDNTYGYCSHDSEGNSTIFVDYTDEGAQRLFFHGNLCDGGQLDYAANGSGKEAIDGTFSVYAHLGGTPDNKFAYASFSDHVIRTRAGNKISKGIGTDANTFAAPTSKYDPTGEYAQYTCVIFDEHYDEGLVDEGNLAGWNQVPGMIRIGGGFGKCKIAKVGAFGGGILGPFEGLIVNHEADFYFDDAQEAEWFSIFYGGVAPYLTRPGLWWSHWRITWNGDATTGSPSKSFAAAAGNKESQIGASIIGFKNTTNGISATFPRNAFGFAPNQAPGYVGANPTGGQVDIATYRVNPNAVGSWPGTSAGTNLLNLTASHGIHEIPFGTPPSPTSPLVGHAVNVPDYLVFRNDARGVRRTRKAAGPLEPAPRVQGPVQTGASLAIGL